MMNVVWGVMILLGLVVGMLNGQSALLVDSMINGCAEAVTLCISLAGAYMLWMGLLEVAKDLGVIDKFAKFIRPFMRWLFPKATEAIAPMTLNLAANFFGMGSAATPFGLEAMSTLQKDNPYPDTATDDMCMFIALNASALELLPTTVLAMRTAAGSLSPYSVILPIAIASVVSFVCAIIICKFLQKSGRKKCSL